AVWSEISRVHRVRIVVVRIRVLNLHDEKPREVWSRPILVKLVSLLLNDAVVTGEMEPFAVIRLQIRIGRQFAKAVEVGGKMAVIDDERILCFRVRVDVFGKQTARTE